MINFLNFPKNKMIAGVDEVGRGSLAGSVLSAAVILNPKKPISGLKDSKKINENRRNILFLEIQKKALFWGIGKANHKEIDRIGILQAVFLSMKRAVLKLVICPDLILIDGNRNSNFFSIPAFPIVRGDNIVPEISAAAILAKVIRDQKMKELDKLYPKYFFAKNKGYPTKAHLKALMQYGPTKFHRKSFAPVRKNFKFRNL